MEWTTVFNQKIDNHLYYATKEREGWNRMHVKMEEIRTEPWSKYITRKIKDEMLLTQVINYLRPERRTKSKDAQNPNDFYNLHLQ